MKIILQRVSSSRVKVNGHTVGEISRGVMLLLGVHKDDTRGSVDYLVDKCVNLRVFAGENGKMNLSVKDINGEVLVVSQFTLLGDCSKGLRPSFTNAAAPDKGKMLYEYFVEQLKNQVRKVETGIFGAMMEVELVNDGPVTFVLEK